MHLQKLLAQAKQVFDGLDNDRLLQENGSLSGIVALGYAYLNWEKGVDLLRAVFRAQRSDGCLPGGEDLCQFPVYGFLLAGFYELAPDEQSARDLLTEMFPKVVSTHRYFYHERDPEEEGLIVLVDNFENLLAGTDAWPGLGVAGAGQELRIQDPLFNALLVWSNECLLDIGNLLGQDVVELLEWNELTVYSMNDKLWDEGQGLYRAFDLQTADWVPGDCLLGILPLIGEIPDQDQAELMLQTLRSKRYDPLDQRMGATAGQSILAHWLLYHGLWRFGMTAAANKIRHESLSLMAKEGFRAAYCNGTCDADAGNTDVFLPAAALCLTWLMEEN